MHDHYDKQRQFNIDPWVYFEKLDFINWYRYFFIVKALCAQKPKTVLEIGPGEKTIMHVIEPFVEKYETFDINNKLEPTYVGDVRVNEKKLHNRYDAVIAADILEHIPFNDIQVSLENLQSYLKKGGRAHITIPHRASNFMFMTPTQVPHAFRIPTGFLSLGSFYRRFIKRKIWIDPDHEWETGDGHHKIKDVEAKIKAAGFKILERKRLIYVDYWILEA